MFQEIADLYGMDWRQLVAHADRESRLNPNAQGGAGEYGLMQILPATWNEWAPLVQVSDPWDPYSNILVGAAYYSYIHSYFSDLGYADPQWSLAAYNWGPERTLGLLDSGGGWFALPLTQRMYVADILIGMKNAPTLAEDAEIRYPRGE
ncbi:MAG: transglycosylase SLT domain-containing protein [Chloroflexi bacterium]|nr:transglycosylase SLT domain-containing protein [Chloroflexota bacterium]